MDDSVVEVGSHLPQMICNSSPLAVDRQGHTKYIQQKGAHAITTTRAVSVPVAALSDFHIYLKIRFFLVCCVFHFTVLDFGSL